MMGDHYWLGLTAFIASISLASCVQEEDPCTNKTQVADDKYCDKYWDCASGQSVLRDCPNGLVFAGDNQGVAEGCDYPWKSNYCKHPKIQINLPIRSQNCEWAYGIFKHIVPCSRYWSCWNGTATEQLCAGDLWYSDITHTCEDSDNVRDCKDNIFPESTEDYYYIDDYDIALYDETPRVKIHTVFLNICDVHLPFRDSCEKYRHCNKGWPRIKKCPEALVFDRISLQCVKPPTENCGVPTIQPHL